MVTIMNAFGWLLYAFHAKFLALMLSQKLCAPKFQPLYMYAHKTTTYSVKIR